MPVVNKGDIIVIPAPTDSNKNERQITIRWSQSWSSRQADYYVLTACNKSQDNANVPLFIEAERFNDGYLGGIGSRTSDGSYECTIDDKYQYGQKSPAGDMRFLVLHDKDRKPYQHRFLESAVGSLVGNAAVSLSHALGVGGFDALTDTVHGILKGVMGDYLRTF